jgi:hypothetical protein
MTDVIRLPKLRNPGPSFDCKGWIKLGAKVAASTSDTSDWHSPAADKKIDEELSPGCRTTQRSTL